MRNSSVLTVVLFAASAGACDRAPDRPAGQAAVAAEPLRAHGTGNGQGRGLHWQKRMADLQARSRAELGIDEATAARLMALQTDLRTFRHELRREAQDSGLKKEEGEARLRARMIQFQVAISDLIGPDRAHRYLRLMAETPAERGRNP